MEKRIMNIGILCLGLVLIVLFPVIGTDGAQGATKHLTIGAVQPEFNHGATTRVFMRDDD